MTNLRRTAAVALTISTLAPDGAGRGAGNGG